MRQREVLCLWEPGTYDFASLGESRRAIGSDNVEHGLRDAMSVARVEAPASDCGQLGLEKHVGFGDRVIERAGNGPVQRGAVVVPANSSQKGVHRRRLIPGPVDVKDTLQPGVDLFSVGHATDKRWFE